MNQEEQRWISFFCAALEKISVSNSTTFKVELASDVADKMEKEFKRRFKSGWESSEKSK